ncbi:MAG: hypothetical protein AAGG75_10435 [Bacteroidota bacterium]
MKLLNLTKQELTQYRDMLMVIRDRVKQAIASGLTFEEIQASNLSKDYDDTWGTGFIKPETLMSILYSDLERKK